MQQPKVRTTNACVHPFKTKGASSLATAATCPYLPPATWVLFPFASGGPSGLSPPVGSSQHSFRGDNPQLMAITEIPTSTGYSHQSIQTFPLFYVTALRLTLRHQMGRSDINEATSWLYDLRQLEPSMPSFLPVKWQWWPYFIWVYGN